MHSKTKLRQEINLESPETDTRSRNRTRTYFSSSDTGISRYIAENKKETYCDTLWRGRPPPKRKIKVTEKEEPDMGKHRPLQEF
jgi:hypothetical protein